jgi:hypothetical protein
MAWNSAASTAGLPVVAGTAGLACFGGLAAARGELRKRRSSGSGESKTDLQNKIFFMFLKGSVAAFAAFYHRGGQER